MRAILVAALMLAAAAFVPAHAQEKPATPEKPVGAGILADQLREGDVSPGDKYNLEVGSRFHKIHTKFMAIKCETCHAGVKFPENIQFLRREEFPLAAYPGAVDRGTCMGCHRGEGALATPFYGVPVK
jgi:hypothetical protein